MLNSHVLQNLLFNGRMKTGPYLNPFQKKGHYYERLRPLMFALYVSSSLRCCLQPTWYAAAVSLLEGEVLFSMKTPETGYGLR